MVGANEADFNLHFIGCRRQTGKHELNVHTLLIHVANARASVIISPAGRWETAPHERREMRLDMFSRSRLAQHPQFLAPTGTFDKPVAVAIGRLEFFSPAQPMRKGTLQLSHSGNRRRMLASK